MRGVHGVNTLSFSALYIEAWFRSWGDGPDVCLGSGTGFLVGVPGDFWLVTARHVVSGRNAETDELEDDRGFWPDYLRVRFARQGEEGEFEPVDQDVALYADGDEAQAPVWRSPAQQRADVAAVPIGSVPEGAVDAFLLTGWPTVRDLYPQDRRAGPGAEADAELPLRVTDRLYVLGFPFGDTGSWPFAVWTAAPVASEPLARWNGLPGFLLDSRTRSGKSGSPVLMHIRPGEMVLAGGEVHVHELDVGSRDVLAARHPEPRSEVRGPLVPHQTLSLVSAVEFQPVAFRQWLPVLPPYERGSPGRPQGSGFRRRRPAPCGCGG